jgi:hypothetical protein
MAAYYTGRIRYKGIEAYTYSADFGDMSQDPDLTCFCTTPDTCLKKGVHDLTNCVGKKLPSSIWGSCLCAPVTPDIMAGQNGFCSNGKNTGHTPLAVGSGMLSARMPRLISNQGETACRVPAVFISQQRINYSHFIRSCFPQNVNSTHFNVPVSRTLKHLIWQTEDTTLSLSEISRLRGIFKYHVQGFTMHMFPNLEN